jgi:arylsulfatase A
VKSFHVASNFVPQETVMAGHRWLHRLLIVVVFCGLSSSAFAAKPNIVFVLFDDLGYGQPANYRAETTFRMPHFEQLARDGMRFTDAHSAAAVCTPTRYGVLTGRYPSRIGQFGVCTTYSPPIIPTSRLTVASLLKRAGYETACVGKWHLGLKWADGKPGTQNRVPIGAKLTEGPNDLGFDYFYGFTHARNIGTIIEQNAVVANVEPVENQPLMIRKAVDWIDQRAGSDKPFFLYFPMCPPHTPVVPSPEFAGKSGAEDRVGRDSKYGDWILQGDAMLGQLLDALKRNGFADNTLVIATSDNGAEHREYPPLRESKRSIYEGGHRVPFVARWPGHVKVGSTCDATICLNDLMATAAAITNETLPDNAAEDSVSLLGLLTGEAAARGATIHQSSKGDLAIRRGNHKLIFFKDGRRELYNLTADLSERHDIADENSKAVTELTALMQRSIDAGRSTPGAAQQNEFSLSLKSAAKKPNSGRKKKSAK